MLVNCSCGILAGPSALACLNVMAGMNIGIGRLAINNG